MQNLRLHLLKTLFFLLASWLGPYQLLYSIGETKWEVSDAKKYGFKRLHYSSGNVKFEWESNERGVVLLKNGRELFKSYGTDVTFGAHDITFSANADFVAVLLKKTEVRTGLPAAASRVVIIGPGDKIVSRLDLESLLQEIMINPIVRIERIYGVSDTGKALLFKVVRVTQSGNHFREYETVNIWRDGEGFMDFSVPF